MKNISKILRVFAAILLLSFVIASCNKPDAIIYNKEGAIYMPRAAGDSKLALLLTDTAQTATFGAAYGGLKYPSNDITVTFKIDSTLINSYNAQNGTSYIMLPASSYQIPSLSAVIKAGQTGSNSLPVKITTTNLDKGGKYILPVTIANVTSGTIDSTLRTTFFTIDTIRRLEEDITSMATLTVSKDNGGGPDANEGSKKLVDGNYNSKFLTDGFPQAFWVQLTFPTAQIIGAYTITSGNDAPERDMKDWNLAGSNDGTTWTVLDTQTGETFSGRNLTKRYEFTNTTAYMQYRINVLANNGSNLIQVSEWRLITYP
ncbi:MAG: DUF1735 domain-containing protein [Bacteroidota bacterium]|nr:DUF1735 domain-containing protein [Bacteroidota bacterium]